MSLENGPELPEIQVRIKGALNFGINLGLLPKEDDVDLLPDRGNPFPTDNPNLHEVNRFLDGLYGSRGNIGIRTFRIGDGSDVIGIRVFRLSPNGSILSPREIYDDESGLYKSSRIWVGRENPKDPLKYYMSCRLKGNKEGFWRNRPVPSSICNALANLLVPRHVVYQPQTIETLRNPF